MTFGKFTMYKIYPYFGFQCNRLSNNVAVGYRSHCLGPLGPLQVN